jgi:hypothetical protein
MRKSDDMKEQLHLRLSAALTRRLEERARACGLSKNELINEALALYLTQDLTDESLMIAKETETQRVLGLLEKKLDLFMKLTLDWNQHLLSLLPEAPADARTRAALAKRAAERNDEFLRGFQRRLPRLPALLEALLADFLETEGG